MTNLAEGFMLISEQEKSGKVERRKDMQTMTSAYANKMLKSLIEKVVYSKDTKNAYGKGNEIGFQLDIFPKIQKNN